MNEKLIVANWKSNGSRSANENWCRELKAHLAAQADRTLCVCPPFPYLDQLRSYNLAIQLGAQDISAYPPGAHTGEVNAAMLRDMGCQYALIGHSERRGLLNESAELLGKKLAQAIGAELKPIFCVGESHTQYQAGQTNSIIKQQLEPIIKVKSQNFIIAYEPVWAIGTGLAATPEYANSVHSFIKKTLGGATQVLYGGSINAQNAHSFLACAHIAGLLVGGASLDAKSILSIYQS